MGCCQSTNQGDVHKGKAIVIKRKPENKPKEKEQDK